MLGLRVRCRALVVVGVAMGFRVLGACASFSGPEAPSGSTLDGGDEDANTQPSPADGTASDAASADATTDGAAPPNLLLNGAFEPGCDGWTAAHGALSDEPALFHAGSGSASCLVCSTGVEAYGILQDVTRVSTVGETYRAEAFVRAPPPGDAATASGLGASITTFDEVAAVDVGSTTGPALDDTWKRAPALLRVSRDGGTIVRFEVISNAPGTCFLIDDARLYVE